jgi:transcriptional regulator GlxA family with amidase domain
MQITFLLFDSITALDVVGPYEVLSRLPDVEVRMVAPQPGPKRTDQGGLALHADHGLEKSPTTDILVVPGGVGVRALLDDAEVLDWVRDVHASSRWTTSVCTGALLLGAAGVLDGLEATTHWASLSALSAYGARPVERRIVDQGKVITAAGVSAGIDMALHLAGLIAGTEVAESIQLTMEYDPDPPFDAGSRQKASAAVVEHAERALRRRGITDAV